MPAARRISLLKIWCAVSALGLMAVTFPLWLPVSPVEPFPQVPLFGWCCRWPLAVDWVAVGLLAGSWLVLAWSASRIGSAETVAQRADAWGRRAALLIVLSSFLLVCLNQHRLQPWHYQLGVFAAVFALGGEASTQLAWLRWLVASIYFYSALSKFDFEFFHTVGPELITPMLKAIGRDPTELLSHPDDYAVWIASLPVFELTVALGVCLPRARRLFGWLAICLHVGLLLVLGPWGLNHSWGVLLWNVHFIGLAWLLFIRRPPAPAESVRMLAGGGRRLALVLLPVMLLPVFERTGYWDHWMSWALYAPHSSRVEIRVAGAAVERLPASLQAILPDPGESVPLWVELPIDKWSLATLYAPVVPQERYQFGVARYVTACVNAEFEIQVDLLGPADRLTGKRRKLTLDGARQVLEAERYFWFNTRPRLPADGSAPN